MKAWPLSLPQYVNRSSYRTQPVSQLASFEPDAGLPIERPEGSVELEQLYCSTFMTLAQFATFKDFFRRDLGRGVLPFLFPHPDTRQPVEAKLTGDPRYSTRVVSAVEREVSFELTVILP